MAIFGKSPCQTVVKLHLYCNNFWNTCLKWIKIVFLDSSCHVLSKNINFIWFLGGPKFYLMTSLWRHLDNLYKFLCSFEKTIKSYWNMPNFKSISFKMTVLQGGGQNLPSPCVCYPKDPMWNRVNPKWKVGGGNSPPWRFSFHGARMFSTRELKLLDL